MLLSLVAAPCLAAPAEDEMPPGAMQAGFLAQWSGSLTNQFSMAKQTVGERATAFGVARFAVHPATFPPELSIRSLEVEVGGRRLSLPVRDEGASTPTPEEGTAP